MITTSIFLFIIIPLCLALGQACNSFLIKYILVNESDFMLNSIYVIYPLTVIFFFLVAFMNPGYQKKAENYFHLIEQLAHNKPEKGCPECKILRPERSQHCYNCKRCVNVFDHHCPFINNCVGTANLKVFIAFIVFIELCVVLVLAFNVKRKFYFILLFSCFSENCY